MSFLSNLRTTLGLGGVPARELTLLAPESGSTTDTAVPVLGELGWYVDPAATELNVNRTDTVYLASLDFTAAWPTGEVTEPGLMGLPGQPHLFDTKLEQVDFSYPREDDARISMVEDPINEREHDTWDLSSLRVTETVAKTVWFSVPRLDTARPVLYESGSPDASVTVPKSGTDTVSISLTETSYQPVPSNIPATDTASIVCTEASVASIIGRTFNRTDTTSLTTVDEYGGVKIALTISMFASDSANLVSTGAGAVAVETLFREETINLTWPEWTISLRLK